MSTIRPPSSTGELVISVEDTGIGIAPANLATIFERFYQVKANRMGGPQTYEGTGIGLSLVSELVKILGGTIAVSSTEGVGTNFTVRLPLAGIEQQSVADGFEMMETAEHSDNLPVILTDTTLPTPVTDNILLIIDDNADIRAYVRTVFELDYHIIEAEDGLDGLEKATANLPNVIICDLMMPQLDGFGFCKALKTQEVTSHIPVIMLTAKARVEDRIVGFEVGADDYLIKPFNPTELRVRVNNLIQQRERLYYWFSHQTPASEEPSATSTTTGAPPVLPPADQKFLDRLSAIVNQNLSEPTFNVESLAEAANLSRTQLNRKLKAIADTSPTNFIREIRLTKATELLLEGEESVTQIAYAVGFDNPSYFTKVFQERYQTLPSQYGKTTNGRTIKDESSLM
ncbi:hybrid sensor histidine kinase/response regulator transcription factor [Spirosoma foliorum]|uniref:hybrid sensor histidine kinase/response regulator transcription factor n=1 Tax=Spirosoma foliorum TaxID=2710596 RepID=UPI00286980A0|nr:response regulator [Spirosoma foliorum]